MEFEWNIFPEFNTLQLSQEVQEILLRLNETPENFTGRILCMSFSYMQADLEQDNGHFSVLVQKKKWYSISEDSPQGEWDKMAEKMTVTLAESGHPVFRATSPLSRGQLKSRGGGKLSIHYCADQDTTTTVFRTIPLHPAVTFVSVSPKEYRKFG